MHTKKQNKTISCHIETNLIRLPWRHIPDSSCTTDQAVGSQPGMPAVSIILPTRERTGRLGSFLTSLSPAAGGVPFEILLYHRIDNAEELKDLTDRFPVSGCFHDRDVFGERRPFSWSYIMNHGLQRSRGRWIMYASDDLVLHPGAFSTALKQAGGCEFIGGISFLHRNTEETYGGFFEQYGFDTLQGKTYINFGLVRRKALMHTNGFDEAFGFYWADVDICMQVWAAGFEVLPCLEALVDHNNINDRIKEGNSGTVFETDTERFYKKWRFHNLFNGVNPLAKTRYIIQ